jgi:hypothetical protein
MGLPVQITRRAPRGRLPCTLAGPVMRLAPTWPERKIEDSRELVAAYPARLSGLGVADIDQRLRLGSPRGGS